MTDWTLAYLGETDKKENAFEWRLANIIKGLQKESERKIENFKITITKNLGHDLIYL